MAYDTSTFDPKAAAEARKAEMEEITSKLLKGIKDASLYEDEIRLVSIMRMDFELLEEIIEDLDESDSKIMKQYLLEGRLFKEIADDFDKHGNEIKAGMFLRMEDGSIEEIYACTDSYGKEDLGINASNDEYLKRHGLGEFDREFYSLSSFSLRETELCQSEPTQGHSGMEMK